MSVSTENVIPDNHGKIFETNAKEADALQKIEHALLKLEGIKDVIVNQDTFPVEVTVHTNKMVPFKSVEAVIRDTGFHAVPKSLFKL